MDRTPAEIYATLLDEGHSLCSLGTMYRVLACAAEGRAQRNQLRPVAPTPELLATRPNEVWSWDITTRLSPAKWTDSSLYVILDTFSRYVVGWMVAHHESAAVAERRIAATCEQHEIVPGPLTIHADRGSSMTSTPVAWLLADLGITRTHSRPHLSNDNPFSEAQFKTLTYRPDFPARFATYEAARTFCHPFFPWSTPSTGMAASACSRRRWCTPAKLRPCVLAAPTSWPPPTPPTPSGSSAGRPRCRRCRPRSGSTRRRRPTKAPGSLRSPRLLPQRRQEPLDRFGRGGALSRYPPETPCRRPPCSHHPRGATLNATHRCLKVVDTFRPGVGTEGCCPKRRPTVYHLRPP